MSRQVNVVLAVHDKEIERLLGLPSGLSETESKSSEIRPRCKQRRRSESEAQDGTPPYCGRASSDLNLKTITTTFSQSPVSRPQKVFYCCIIHRLIAQKATTSLRPFWIDSLSNLLHLFPSSLSTCISSTLALAHFSCRP